MTSNTWVLQFCNSYAPDALWLAKLFIYLGLLMGVLMAAAEVYKLYREAKAIKVADDIAEAPAPTAAVAEVLKGLVGVLTGAKAWLAIVIVGVIIFWLAGNAVPGFCAPD